MDRLDKVDYVSNILYQTDIIITAIYIPSSADESASPCLDLGYIHTGCPINCAPTSNSILDLTIDFTEDMHKIPKLIVDVK